MLSPLHLPSSLVSILLLALPLNTFASSPFVASPSAAKIRPRSGVAQNVLESKPETRGYCSPSGPIDNTLCEYETLERTNGELYPALHELVKTPFFKFFRVDLFKECPFWYENAFCMNRACGVETADESEVPEKWRMAALSSIERTDSSDAMAASSTCYYRDQDFCEVDDESQNEGQFVDLVLNPERFTGYAGASASKVWSSIYEENCFGLSELAASAGSSSGSSSSLGGGGLGGGGMSGADGLKMGGLMGGGGPGLSDGLGTEMRNEAAGECLEKKIYYRIISGLHASISQHICSEYLDQETGEWSPNLECFISRIASHPERLQNMYFNLVLMLRAVSRAGPYLEAYDIQTGDVQWDAEAKKGLKKVVEASHVDGEVFDEAELFRGNDALILKGEFKDRFRNVSRIMDCVGCDKCRLWGKLQVSGVGTALKILFELDEETLDPKKNPGLLSRSEIVALFNTLHRFSESLHSVEEFRILYQETKKADRARTRAQKAKPNPQPSHAPLVEPPIPFLAHAYSSLLSHLHLALDVCRSYVSSLSRALRMQMESWRAAGSSAFFVSGSPSSLEAKEKQEL